MAAVMMVTTGQGGVEEAPATALADGVALLMVVVPQVTILRKPGVIF